MGVFTDLLKKAIKFAAPKTTEFVKNIGNDIKAPQTIKEILASGMGPLGTAVIGSDRQKRALGAAAEVASYVMPTVKVAKTASTGAKLASRLFSGAIPGAMTALGDTNIHNPIELMNSIKSGAQRGAAANAVLGTITDRLMKKKPIVATPEAVKPPTMAVKPKVVSTIISKPKTIKTPNVAPDKIEIPTTGSKTIRNMISSKVNPLVQQAAADVGADYTVRPVKTVTDIVGKRVKSKSFVDDVINEGSAIVNRKKPTAGQFDEFVAATGEAFKKLGNRKDAAAVAQRQTLVTNIKATGTKFGQAINMYKTLYNVDPQIKAEMMLKEFADTAKENGLKIAPDVAEEFEKNMRKGLSLKTPELQQQAVESAIELMQSKVPARGGKVFEMYRYNNALSGPATQSRNVLLNAVQTLGIEPLQVLGEQGPVAAAKYEFNALKAIPAGFKAAKEKMMNPSTLYSREFTPANIGSAAEGTKLNWLQKLLTQGNIPTRGMEAGDKFFSTIAKAGRMSIGDTEENALKRAEQILFRSNYDPLNKTGQGKMFSAVDKMMMGMDNTMSKNLKGLPKAMFMMFVRTPYMAAKEAMKYTPINMVNLLDKSVDNKRRVAVQLAIGSMASGISMAAAVSGRTTWRVPSGIENSGLSKDFYGADLQPMSIQIGNRQIPFNEFGVLGVAMAIPACIEYYRSQDPEAFKTSGAEKVIKTLADLSYYMMEQSPVSQGLNTMSVFTDPEKQKLIPKSAAFMAGQFIWAKGALQYLARAFDNSYRKGFDENWINQFVNNIKKDLPGLSQTLPAYTKPDGTEEKRPLSWYTTGFENKVIDEPNRQIYQDNLQQKQERNAFNAIGSMSDNGATPEAISSKLDQLNARVNETPQGTQTAQITGGIKQPQNISDILTSKRAQDKKNGVIDDILKLNVPYEKQIQAAQAQGITEDEVNTRMVNKLDTKEKSGVLFDWVNSGKYDMAKLYEKDLLTSEVAKQWEREGKIDDADSLINKLKMTDIYEQKKYNRQQAIKLRDKKLSINKSMFAKMQTIRQNQAKQAITEATNLSKKRTSISESFRAKSKANRPKNTMGVQVGSYRKSKLAVPKYTYK